ncbi:MAG: efflux RND transporter permease subunit [Gammaproteobacteria bacterium]
MGFTDIFIRRPVFATVISLLLLVVGLIAATKLSIRQFPKIDANVISVTTAFPGASPNLMEGFITTPIESAMGGISGVDYITSSSSQNTSNVVVHFKLGYDVNAGLTDVSNAVASVRTQLPKGINDPIVKKNDPNANPTEYIAFYSDRMSSEAITDYLERVVQTQLETLPGVGRAIVLGERRYAMRIWLDPFQMAARGVTPDDVQAALNSSNLQSPTGAIQAAYRQINVNAATDLKDPEQFNNLVVLNAGGQLIRIKDIGHAELGAASTTTFSVNMNGKPGVVIGIIPQTDANPLAVSKEVNAALQKISPLLPSGLNMKVVWDTSKFISSSIHEVIKTIFETVLFVIVVVFLFLGSFRVLLIPTITIPLSLIGAFGLMLMMGFSINTMTLLALVLAIGMVVDDAIVVSENIHRHIEAGQTPFNAALIGAREIQFAIIAMTITLAAVYAPIGFLSDITGFLFKEFAFTLAGTVIISGFIALTLSPMMCSKIMTPKVLHGRFPQLIDNTLQKLVNGYRKLLLRMISYTKVVLIAVAVIACIAGLLYKILPRELAPAEDTGAIMTIVQGPPAATLKYMEKYTQSLERIYHSVPEMQSFGTINGINGVNSAISFLVLKPWSERSRSVSQIIQSLFPQMWSIPGIKAFPVNPYKLPGADDIMPLNFRLQTTGNYEQLADVMNKIFLAASQNPGLMNVNTDLKFDTPQLEININRNLAADLGVSMYSIGNALNIGLGEPTITRFDMQGRSYDVIPELLEMYRNQTDTLNDLHLRTSSGQLVPLGNLVSLREIVAPPSLDHFQQMRAASLTASLRPGYSLGQALQFMETTAKQYLQPGMRYDFASASRQFLESSGSMGRTFLFALIFIYLVLSAQFESFLDPLIVMFSVVPATMGGLLALKLTNGTMNIYTQIGLITLIGLISKHGILMVEFANQLRAKGKNLQEAIVDAAAVRLRPILMTTAAMVLGAVPLAFAAGAGALSRNQLGWVIVGGMVFGTMVTLFVVPSVYITLNLLKEKWVAARIRE